MNCVEFRRKLGIDPQSAAADFLRHRGECARCAEAGERACAFDRDLRRALNVAVPAQLADSLLLAQTTAERRRRASWRRRGSLFAVAAALILAVGLAGMRAEAKPLSQQAIDHLHREVSVLALTNPVPADAVTAAFAERGLTLKSVPGGITFVACCPLGKRPTIHLVMANADDPISVIYLVDQHVDNRQDFQRDGLQGRIVPLGQGSLILLAKQADQFDRVESVWRAAL
jgi:Protein of unknown function (DUF3379)